MTRIGGAPRRAASAVAGVVVVAAALAMAWLPEMRRAGPERADVTTLTALIDADVRSPEPTTSYGTSPALSVDATLEARTFIAFDAGSLAGREVVGARLELLVIDGSDAGGDVVAVSAPWSERVTWNTQPATEPGVLAAIGKATARSVKSTPLPTDVVTNGRVSLAIVPTSSDGARYSSREGQQPPRLVVTLAGASSAETASSSTTGRTTTTTTRPAAPPPADDAAADGVTTSPATGSSDPTLFATNSRLAVTGGGRLLGLHGKHRDGVQLVWRDRGKPTWVTSTRGSVSDGRLLSSTGTGDWTASIVVARVGDVEHAWVVMAHDGYRTAPAPVWFRRLSALDAPEGPTVGPAVALTDPDVYTKRADLRAGQGADGALRLSVVWTERAGRINRVRAAWLDTGIDEPSLAGITDLTMASSREVHGSFVETDAPAPLVLVVKGASGKIRLHRHASLQPGTPWSAGAATADAGTAKNAPHGVVTADGTILVVVQPDPTIPSTTAFRFSPDGATVATAAPRLENLGAPALSIVGSQTWIVTLRGSDRAVVASRLAATGWSDERVLLPGSSSAGLADAPNVEKRSRDGRLRVIVRGGSPGSSKHDVLFVQRLVE